MIDLTPLDVRNKRGDFKKLMRGYDPQEVDVFLEIVAERLEALIRENMALKERASALQAQVNTQAEREQAVQAALVTAQELRADIRSQAQREAENILKEAETERRRLIAEAEAEARSRLRDSERKLDHLVDSLQEMERRRARFLRDFRQLLERELDVVEVEENRAPLEERAIDLDLGSRRARAGARGTGDKSAVGPGAASPGAEGQRADPKGAGGSEPRAGGEPLVRPDAPAEVVPPPDVPVDQLAAAYERALASDDGEPSITPPPAPPSAHRTENLSLYLDPDQDRER
ncbi:MAG TPA: DivIVA domain-containing protein [Longimicrobiales bacterium]|nr:DivIVA domain-containing protein [Longimicrobiales bacterium]